MAPEPRRRRDDLVSPARCASYIVPPGAHHRLVLADHRGTALVRQLAPRDPNSAPGRRTTTVSTRLPLVPATLLSSDRHFPGIVPPPATRHPATRFSLSLSLLFFSCSLGRARLSVRKLQKVPPRLLRCSSRKFRLAEISTVSDAADPPRRNDDVSEEHLRFSHSSWTRIAAPVCVGASSASKPTTVAHRDRAHAR